MTVDSEISDWLKENNLKYLKIQYQNFFDDLATEKKKIVKALQSKESVL